MKRRRSAASLELASEKVAEAQFFLAQLREARADSFVIRCLFSATASAAYSSLEALKAAASRDRAFSAWAAAQADALRADPVASYVLERRNENVHIGETRVRSVRLPIGEYVPPMEHWFRLQPAVPEPIDVPVVAATARAVEGVAAIVSEARRRFPRHTRTWLLDPERRREGLTIEEIEERLGFPRGWSAIRGATDPQRLAALARSTPPPALDPRFDGLAERFMGWLRERGQVEEFRERRASES